MAYNNELVAGKLRRWEKYILEYRLPRWEDIPDIGLYMEQLITLLRQYLDYLPPELKEEEMVTAATVNNYVRKKIMPEPEHKRYYRKHIAFLLIICSLKQGLSISTFHSLIPVDMTEEELRNRYCSYVEQQRVAVRFFIEQIRLSAGKILEHELPENPDGVASTTEELITMSAIISGFLRLMSEKLLLLEGKTLEDGGSIEIRRTADTKALNCKGE